MTEPSVLAFAGHMIDVPDRAEARFPPPGEERVAAAIRAQLELHRAVAGVSSLACGGDILFAEALLARRAELHVMLPLCVEEFLDASVRISGDVRWEDRFHSVRERARSVEIHGDDYLAGSGTPFQLAALLIDGQAQLLANEHSARAVTLGVWDGRPGDGLGGTASFIGHAVSQGREVWSIHPRMGAVSRPGRDAIVAAQRHAWRTVQIGAATVEHRLAAFLFADARGFGSLRETQIPVFLRVALGVIDGALRQTQARPLVVNTWGDGLFVVTARARDAADLALRLLEGAARVDWSAEGLPGLMSFRVGLHAGPTFVTTDDPIVRRANAYGREVSRAARIEPITPPGQAWASRAFAVLAAATGCDGIAFTDLGDKTLAKDAGTMRLFAVGRA